MIDFVITPDNGESFEITATSRHILEWEVMDRRNTLSKMESNPEMNDLYTIAFIAARRVGKFSGTLDEWKTTVDIQEKKNDDPNRDDLIDLIIELGGDASPNELADAVLSWMSQDTSSDPTRPGR